MAIETRTPRVLILSYYFPPFNAPGAQHPDFFHRFLRERGFETVAVTSALHYNPSAAPQPFPDKSADVFHLPEQDWQRRMCRRLYKAEMQVQVRMKRWQPGFVWAKLFAVPAAARLLGAGGIDAMISVSPPVSSHWAALRLKKRFPAVRWIADFQDPFVGNPFETHPRATEKRFEREIFSRADVLSANTDTALAMWRDRYPEHAEKITVTWGGYDPDEAIEAAPLASSTPVLSHVGVIFGARIPKLLFESISRLSDHGLLKPDDLVVEFVGDLDFGPIAPLAEKLAARGLIRMRATYVPRAEALRIACQSHYSLLLDITPGNGILQVPAKLFDQIRIGRPILAFTPKNSPAGRILERSGIAHQRVEPDGPPEAADAALLGMLRLPPEPVQPCGWFRETFYARNLAASIATKIPCAPGHSHISR